MSARDVFHKAVKNALIKERWDVTDDPLIIQFGGVDLRIDLGAERLVAAEKDGERIAVEIKSFLSPSVISDFHVALGQVSPQRSRAEQASNSIPKFRYTNRRRQITREATRC